MVPVMGSAVLTTQLPASARITTQGPQLSVFAAGTTTMYGPDDVTKLGDHIFVAWQNGIGPSGEASPSGATTSDVTEFTEQGSLLATWAIPGHVDGLTAQRMPDGGHTGIDTRISSTSGDGDGRLLVTSNEDGNSSFFTIDPSEASSKGVRQYAYSPSTLPHGGGTDAISVVGDQIFVSASAPTAASGPAVYSVTLTGPTAQLRPAFSDTTNATVASTTSPDFGKPVTLALTDPDSNEVVPRDWPRFGGDLVLDSQGDGQQIYVSNPGKASQSLSVLNLSQSINDTAFVTSSQGRLLISDTKANKVYLLAGVFPKNTALVAVTPMDANVPVNQPNYLGSLNIWTGRISTVLTSVQPNGLLFVPGHSEDR